MEKNKNFYLLLFFLLFLALIFFINFILPLKKELNFLENKVADLKVESKKLSSKNSEREKKIKKWKNTVKDIAKIKENYTLNDRVLLRFEMEKLLISRGIIPKSERVSFKRIKNSNFGVLTFEFSADADDKLLDLFKAIREKKLLMGVEFFKVGGFPSSFAVVRIRGLVYESN